MQVAGATDELLCLCVQEIAWNGNRVAVHRCMACMFSTDI